MPHIPLGDPGQRDVKHVILTEHVVHQLIHVREGITAICELDADLSGG